MPLETIFSEPNMLCYSGACLNLAIDLSEARYRKKPIDTLVIPSRGAFPFFLGMVYALDRLRGISDEASRLADNIAVQPMLAPLMPENSKIRTDLEKADMKVLLIPFTADLNVTDFDENLDNDEFVQKTRNFWANVTSSFFLEPETRSKNVYFRTFTETVLRDLEARADIAELYASFPTIPTRANFGMIDTVISGRASNDILQAFDKIARRNGELGQGYDCYLPRAFLIVDADGEKLERNKKFDIYLSAKERQELVKKYPIHNIVSEDTNSSLLGVSAVVYPSLMRDSRALVHTSTGEEFFIGAGSWFIDPEGQNKAHFRNFMNLIYAGIDAMIDVEFGNSPNINMAEVERFNQKRIGFIDYARQREVLDYKDFSDTLQRLPKYKDGSRPNQYQTHSSVIHVPFSPGFTQQTLQKVCGFTGVHCKNNT